MIIRIRLVLRGSTPLINPMQSYSLSHSSSCQKISRLSKMLSSRGARNAVLFDIPWRYAPPHTYDKKTNPSGFISFGMAEHVRTNCDRSNLLGHSILFLTIWIAPYASRDRRLHQQQGCQPQLNPDSEIKSVVPDDLHVLFFSRSSLQKTRSVTGVILLIYPRQWRLIWTAFWVPMPQSNQPIS